MPRDKPYRSNQETWRSILEKKLNIPMNQRQYAWKEEEINVFLEDLVQIFEEDKFSYKMGSIINLEENGNNDIYDGQQRILTTILLLYILGLFSDKIKDKVSQLLTVDTVLDELTKKQKEIKKTCMAETIPKITCVNHYDMKALVNIFNSKVTSPEKYNKSNKKDTFCCSHCNIFISREQDFIRHLTKKHEYIVSSKNSKLNEGYITIYNYFKHKQYPEQKIIELYKFILTDIDIQFYDCWNANYVSRIYDWENNRGVDMATLDVIKNPILVQITNDKKFEIYDKWEKNKNLTHNLYDKKNKYGKRLFDVAIQLYNGKISRTINQENLFKPIISSNDTYEEINKFFSIVQKLDEIMKKISNDKFGRLITKTSRVMLPWESYMWCFLPIFYTMGKIDKELIHLLTMWCFRNIGLKTRNFNNMAYSNEFIIICNKVLTINNYDYYKDFKLCLQKNKDKSIKDKNSYIKTLTETSFRHTNATYLLMFFETNYNTDVHIVPLTYTLEHIYNQKKKII